MPGLSSSRPVKGAHGIGTINIKFGPRKKTSYKGFLLFVFGVSLLVFRFLWSRPILRAKMLTPRLRDAYVRIDYLRWMVGSKLWGGERDLFNQRSSVSETTLTSVPGLKGEWAHIRRDVSSGVVTLSATSAVDAVFAQGYVHAVERLYQLDISRRKAKGTVAEVLGEDYLSHDKVSRILNFHELAKQDWERLSEAAEAETKDKNTKSGEPSRKQVALLTSYAAGINAYLGEGPVLPIEFYVFYGAMRNLFYNWGKAPEVDAWTPVDTLAVMRMQAFESSQGWEKEYLRTVLVEEVGHAAAESLLASSSSSSPSPPYATREGDVTWLPSTTGTAWASTLQGAASAPVVGSDIQSPVDSYNRWYYNELRWAGFGADVQGSVVAGASLPGVPLVMQGRNEHIAWGWAAAEEDTEDLFIGEIHWPANSSNTGEGEGETGDAGPELLLSGGQREAVAVRTEHIAYFDGRGEQAAQLEVLTTRHGPVINDLVMASFMGVSKKYDVLKPSSSSSSSSSSSGSLRFAHLSLSSQALRQPVDLSFLMLMNTARGWADFQEACGSLRATALHVVYADHRGNAGYATTGAPVARHKDCDGTLPCRGDGLRDWKADKDKGRDKGGARRSKPSKLLGARAAVLASTRELAAADSALVSALSGDEGLRAGKAEGKGDVAIDLGASASASAAAPLDRTLASFDDVCSPSSLRLAAIMNAYELPAPVPVPAGGSGEGGRDPFKAAREERQYSEDLQRLQAVRAALMAAPAPGQPFDGHYTPAATAPAVVEVFRQLAAEAVLGSLPHLQGYLRGAPITHGPPRDARGTALLGGHAWLLAVLEGEGDGAKKGKGRDKDKDKARAWLSMQRLDTDSIVKEALLGAADWMARTSTGGSADKAPAATLPPPPAPAPGAGDDSDSVYRWGRHHIAVHTHYARRHTIQSAIMSPPPRPMPGGADDSVFRAPYPTTTASFRTNAHGNQLYTKSGMKGDLVMPFQCCGAGQYMSALRVVSDMGQSLQGSSEGAQAWSAGSALAYHGQTQPDSRSIGGDGSASVTGEVLARAVPWVRSTLFNRASNSGKGPVRPPGPASTADGEVISDEGEEGGPAPWQRRSAGGAGESVLRLLKAAERTRWHDEL